MKPVNNKHFNCVFAVDQPEYQPLPAHKSGNGIVTTCWELSDEDLKTIKKTKKVFFSQMTFNNPLQPISATTDIHEAICLQSCESCGVVNDIETMSMDSGSNWFCEKCWEELEPVMQSEYEEMKLKYSV